MRRPRPANAIKETDVFADSSLKALTLVVCLSSFFETGGTLYFVVKFSIKRGKKLLGPHLKIRKNIGRSKREQRKK